jgi:hypothetical protein
MRRIAAQINCQTETSRENDVENKNQHDTEERVRIEQDNPDLVKINILWHIDALLGNDGEMSSYTTAVAK